MVATGVYIKHPGEGFCVFEEASFTFVEMNQSLVYLRYKVSDEGDVGVEFLQTLADVTDHRQDVATAQQVDHPVEQRLL